MAPDAAPPPGDGWKAARVSLVVGASVLAAKLAAWRLTGSVALYSDALESIVNVVAAVVALAALRFAARPADPGHPWGHGKAEYFSAAVEGSLILVAAASIVRTAVERLVAPQPLHALGAGVAVSVAASVANGLLGWWLQRRGRMLQSPALEADGAHVLTDVYTTIGVLAGVGLARLTGWWVLDPLLALAVAVQVVWTGWRIVREAAEGLLDAAVGGDAADRLEQAVRRAMGGALEFHDLRARRSGASLFVELHLVVPGGDAGARRA